MAHFKNTHNRGGITFYGMTDSTSTMGVSIGAAQSTYDYGISIGSDNAGPGNITYATSGTVINSSDVSGDYRKSLCLGIDGSLKTYIYHDESGWRSPSDIRDKTDIQDIDSEKALKFITNLSGKTYVYNLRDNYLDKETGIFDQAGYLEGTKSRSRRQSGFLAQDVYQTMIDVFGDENYAQIVDYGRFNDPENGKDQYYMSQNSLIAFLVETIKYLKEEIEKVKKNRISQNGGN